MVFNDIKALFFDLDGTLIDSSDDLSNSINYMLRSIGKEQKDEKIIKSWIGNGAKSLVLRSLVDSFDTEIKIESRLLEDALYIFLDHYKKNLCIKTKLYPNVLETLKEAKDQGFVLAIITNKPFEFVKPILKELGIEDYFDLILGGDSLPQKKPSPAPLLHALKKLGLDSNETIMIGDSKNDIISANEANITSFALNYGYNQNEDLSIYNPDLLLDRFEHILDHIKGRV